MTSRVVAIMLLPAPEQLARARQYTTAMSAVSTLVEGSGEPVAWVELFAGLH